MEDSADTDTFLASKDETFDRGHENDEKDCLDLSNIAEQRQRAVTVSVMACRDLRKRILSKNDTYVKVRVAGDEQKTSVIDNGGSAPTWEKTVTGWNSSRPWKASQRSKSRHMTKISPEALTDDLLKVRG